MQRLAHALALFAACSLFSSLAQPGDKDDLVTVFEDSFEGAKPGRQPKGWFVPAVQKQGSYRAEIAEDGYEGATCAMLAVASGEPEIFGNLMRSIDGDECEDRIVRLEAAVRVEGKGARAQLWLRVDYEDGSSDLIDNMGDRPHRSSKWKEYTLEGEVRHGARQIAIGMMLNGGERAWLDDVRLRTTREPLSKMEPEGPRALKGRGLDNVIAFARLYGYVRFFHPSDQNEATDWEALAIRGVQAAEGAKRPKDLAAALSELFAPVAPTVQIHVAGKPPAKLPEALRRPDAEKLYLCAWRHRGIGLSEESIYKSWRNRKRVKDDGPVEDYVDPLEPFAAELGAGIACRVPLSVYSDADRKTLPHQGGDPQAVNALPAGYRKSGDDRACRLAAVVVAWNVFQHFYPYFDVVETDWKAELPRALTAAAMDENEREFLGTVRRLVAALHDGHGQVSHRSDTDRASPPIAVDWIEDQLVVTSVGADAGPLAVGDVILELDGVGAEEALERAEELISGATPQWRRHRSLREVLRGPADEELALLYEAHDRPKRRQRAKLARRGPPAPAEERPEVITELEPGFFYVDLGRVTTEQFKEALEDLAEAQGIVFDMRGYPSGLDAFQFFPHLSEEKLQSAKFMIPLVNAPDRTATEFTDGGWNIEPAAPYLRAKKAFITYGGAISFAESCMGIVEQHALGELVGGPTAGTNGNVNPFVLPGGYRISWTGMKVEKRDGTPHHGVGILPTIPVARTRQAVIEDRDLLLEAALEAVKR